MSHHHHCSDHSCESHEGSCHHGAGSCCSDQHVCHCPCHHEKYSDTLLKLADEAWMEVLKEKIKDDIRKKSSEHLDKLAQLVSATNHQRWKEIMCKKDCVDEFERKLKELMHSK